MQLGIDYSPAKLVDMLTVEQVKELLTYLEKYLADKSKSNKQSTERD